MCDTCGCNLTPGNAHLADQKTVDVLSGLLDENDHVAAHNREHFERHGVLAVNLMSSPGSGKTSLLEATIRAVGDDLRIAVIEGDLEKYAQFPGSHCRNGAVIRVRDGHRLMESFYSHHNLLITGHRRVELKFMARALGLEV